MVRAETCNRLYEVNKLLLAEDNRIAVIGNYYDWHKCNSQNNPQSRRQVYIALLKTKDNC
jgi:hypothetical protein